MVLLGNMLVSCECVLVLNEMQHMICEYIPWASAKH